MSTGLVPGAVLPDFQLPDTTGALHRLSELQGDNPMILLIGRGEHCPRERQHQREMLKMWEWCAVAFTQMVTVLPNDLDDADRLRISTGAYWPYLCEPISSSRQRWIFASTPIHTRPQTCRTRSSSHLGW